MKSRLTLLVTLLLFYATGASAQHPIGGADQKSPSKSEYFAWINNTNEGPTAAQTKVNLNFFRWLHDRYGMELDIYAFDAGALDGSKMYDNMSSARFKSKFPDGFGPLSKQAAAMGTRLGLWCGPDGFGDTEQEARQRQEMMVSLARDYGFGLFKMDAVCGQLRPSKYGYFDEMMTDVRKYVPDFVLLNHRLDLGQGMKHSTTYLLGGQETYIDVHMLNDVSAPHHRAGAISRKSPADLTRLTEDHGVCISSCNDYWEDDLILQSFGRELILAPEIYGNPWLLRDDEFPQLAFIFNLHRTYRDILPEAKRLPEASYGPEALARGDNGTRFLTLRNLSWNPVTYTIRLNDEVGLQDNRKQVKVRMYHPYIEDLGTYKYGSEMKVTVLPFRAALVKITNQPERDKVAITGIPYQIINDKVGNTVEVKLLGMAGKSYNVRIERGGSKFRTAQVDGKALNALAKGKTVRLSFDGKALKEDYHRLLAKMEEVGVPDDASSLYYATCFAADNNALETRELKRSGETAIPEVKAARDAFFNQKLFVEREIWDRYLFDGKQETAFSMNMRWWDLREGSKSAFYLDFGRQIEIDRLVMETIDEYSLSPWATDEGVDVEVSADLKTWQRINILASTKMEIPLSSAGAIRYLKLPKSPLRLTEIYGFRNGKQLDRKEWRANNLFRDYNVAGAKATQAWKTTVRLTEKARGAYICVAANGQHGNEAVWAAAKIGDRFIGCPDRAPSFQSNPWEYTVKKRPMNNTFYIPVTDEMIGRDLEIWLLGLEGGYDAPKQKQLSPEAWITAYPIPFEQKTLTLK